MRFHTKISLILKYSGPALFLTSFVYTLVDQLLSTQLRSPTATTQTLLLFGSLAVVNGILFPILGTTFLLFGISQTHQEQRLSLLEFMKKNLNLMYIETLRSWGKSILWGFAFVIPGLVRMVQYSLVPYVVAMSPEYAQGKIDALKLSKELVNKHWFTLILILSTFNLFIPLIMTELFDTYRVIWQTPFQALLLTAIDCVFLIISSLLLFKLYKKSHMEVTRAAHI